MSSDVTGHWRKSYENKYLGAWDLWDSNAKRYREVKAIIVSINRDTVVGDMGRKTQPLQLKLRGSKGVIPMPLIVSKKTGTTLEMMYGEDPNEWVGKEITLFVRTNQKVQKGTGNVLTVKNLKSGDRARDRIMDQVSDPEPTPEFDDVPPDAEPPQEREPGVD